MLSRALIIATVMLLIGCFAAIPVRAENLEAGKSPSQLFAGTCSACHKGMRGLLKTVPPGSLPGFLRQHYTTSSEMAGMLSAYLLSNGTSDPRGGGLTRQGRDARSEPPTVAPEQAEPRLSRRQRLAVPRDAAKPDAEGLTAQGEPKGEPAARPGRNRRLARPGPDAPEAAKPAVEGQPPGSLPGLNLPRMNLQRPRPRRPKPRRTPFPRRRVPKPAPRSLRMRARPRQPKKPRVQSRKGPRVRSAGAGRP